MNERNFKICVFYCANSIGNEELPHWQRLLEGTELKPIRLPCSGKVDIPYLVKAFETGADGVMIITCKEHECQHIEGNFRAQKRADAVISLLNEIGIDACRMSVMTPIGDGDMDIADGIRDFCTKLEKLPKLSA